MGKKKTLPRISEGEWLVMQVLWSKSTATTKEVVAELAGQTSWKPKTVLTLLNRLVKKSALGFRKDGRAYLYHPMVTEEECVRAAGRSFMERVFRGAASPMLAHFVQEANLSAKDIAELRQILDEKARPGRPRAKKDKA